MNCSLEDNPKIQLTPAAKNATTFIFAYIGLKFILEHPKEYKTNKIIVDAETGMIQMKCIRIADQKNVTILVSTEKPTCDQWKYIENQPIETTTTTTSSSMETMPTLETIGSSQSAKRSIEIKEESELPDPRTQLLEAIEELKQSLLSQSGPIQFNCTQLTNNIKIFAKKLKK